MHQESKMNLVNLVLLIVLELFLQSRNLNVVALEGEAIVGGIKSRNGKYPYQVSLQLHGRHFCGGGIVDSYHVVTAAHCVFDTDAGKSYNGIIEVVGGVENLNVPSDTRETYQVTQIALPIEYIMLYDQDKSGDIAILKVDRPFNIETNPNLNHLLLPPASRNFDGKNAVVTGFGASHIHAIRDLDTDRIFEEIQRSDGKLRFANTLILSDKECTSREPTYEPSISRFCAKIIASDDNGPKGICHGDSGSPLVINGNTLIGIVHFGYKDCDESIGASRYTNVTTFLPFIKATLNRSPYPGVSLLFNSVKKTYEVMTRKKQRASLRQ